MEKEAEFKKLVNKIVTEKIIELKPSKLLLTQSRKLCREVRVDRDGLKTLVYKGTQEMRSLQKSLKKNEIKNIREAKKYYNKYAKELYKLTHEKKKANHLLENCRKITSSLKNNINKQISSSVEPLNTAVINTPKATINTPTTARSTLSPQEVSMIMRFDELSNNFNVVTQNINYLCEQISQLQSQLCSNEQLSLDDINNITATIDIDKNVMLPALECERTNIQSAIINEKNCIELLVKEGKLSPSVATKYINKYNKLINNCEQTIHYFNNRRNKRDLLVETSLSEKLANIATNNKEKLEKISVIKRESTFAR